MLKRAHLKEMEHNSICMYVVYESFINCFIKLIVGLDHVYLCSATFQESSSMGKASVLGLLQT